MSIKLMAEAWGTSGLIASEKLVLIALCDHANEEGLCFPSHKKIAEKCDLSYPSVRRIQSELIKKELLAKLPQFRKDGFQMQNLYQVLPKLSNEGVIVGDQGGDRGRSGRVIVGDQACNHHITIIEKPIPGNLFETLEPALEEQTPKSRFEEFWSLYPKKVCKCDAKRAWDKILNKKHSYDVQEFILNALENHKTSKNHLKREEQFIPHAATWLNGERWLDEVQVDMPFCL